MQRITRLHAGMIGTGPFGREPGRRRYRGQRERFLGLFPWMLGRLEDVERRHVAAIRQFTEPSEALKKRRRQKGRGRDHMHLRAQIGLHRPAAPGPDGRVCLPPQGQTRKPGSHRS